MKLLISIFTCAVLLILTAGCDREDTLQSSDDLGMDRFGPSAGDDQRMHAIFEQHGVWIRMDMKDSKEVYTSTLATDPGANQFDAVQIEDQDRNSALVYAQTLLSQVSEVFTKAFFPLEWWFAKSYGGGVWKYQFRNVGRNRFVLTWPNETEGALPVDDDPDHFYKDSVVTAEVWSYLAVSAADKMPEGIREFTSEGKAYDNGEAVSALRAQYYENERDKYDRLIDELCANGGFVNSGGASNFRSDFSGWIALLATESYENIKIRYLDNSPARAAKYEILVEWLRNYNWDIQAAGNRFREKYDEYLASLTQ